MVDGSSQKPITQLHDRLQDDLRTNAGRVSHRDGDAGRRHVGVFLGTGQYGNAGHYLSTLGSHMATPGKASTIASPITCKPMKGHMALKIMSRVISGGATDFR